MRLNANFITLCLVAALIAGPAGVLAQSLEVKSTLPVQNDQDVTVDTDISVTFSADVNAATINGSSFVVHTNSTGQRDGTISYNAGTRTATFNPDVDFAEGEVISLILT